MGDLKAHDIDWDSNSVVHECLKYQVPFCFERQECLFAGKSFAPAAGLAAEVPSFQRGIAGHKKWRNASHSCDPVGHGGRRNKGCSAAV